MAPLGLPLTPSLDTGALASKLFLFSLDPHKKKDKKFRLSPKEHFVMHGHTAKALKGIGQTDRLNEFSRTRRSRWGVEQGKIKKEMERRCNYARGSCACQ